MRCQKEKCTRRIPKLMKDIHKCVCGNYYCDSHKNIGHNCEAKYFDKNKRCLREELQKVEIPKVVKC